MALVNPAYGMFHAYQPCSVFKIVVAVAGLSERVITADTRLVCDGGCWLWPGHGSLDLRRALAVSCNPYFEQVGERLGYGPIRRYARLLGLGETTGINLTGEARGGIPRSVTAARLGRLSSHATGVRTSALQLAVLLSAVINGGTIYEPQLADPKGFVPKKRWQLPPGTSLEGLAAGFLGAVNEGSAKPAFDPDVIVAGKTGTCSRLGWFASYSPAEEPELVMVVLVRGGSGKQASTLAGQIYREVFTKPAPASAAERP